MRHPKECLDKGDKVKVRILDVSRENRRIALGLKQVNDDPWEQLEAHFTSGKQVEGTVFRILEKGVILQMEMDIEGIIPARDLTKAERDDLLKQLNPGDLLSVTVQELNADDKKVVLMPDFEVKVAAPAKKEEEPAAEVDKQPEASAADAPDAPDEGAAVEADAAAPAGETAAGSAAASVEEAPVEEPVEAPAEAGAAEPAEEEKPKKGTAKKKAASKSDDAEPAAAEAAEKPVKAAAKKTDTKKKAATAKKATAKKAAKAESKDDGKKAGAAKKKPAAKKKAAKDEAQ